MSLRDGSFWSAICVVHCYPNYNHPCNLKNYHSHWQERAYWTAAVLFIGLPNFCSVKSCWTRFDPLLLDRWLRVFQSKADFLALYTSDIHCSQCVWQNMHVCVCVCVNRKRHYIKASFSTKVTWFQHWRVSDSNINERIRRATKVTSQRRWTSDD